MGKSYYFYGRLIQPDPDGHKLWWVKDGDTWMKFTRPSDAEEWCARHSGALISERTHEIELITMRLIAIYTRLDELADGQFGDCQTLQPIAFDIRRAADRLDRLILTMTTPPPR